jgi:DNA-binding PadR family transcriptional regulator
MAVREGLLALLDDGPSHGYQLKTGFEAATGGVWSLNVGQVYTTLERLERDGFVASADEDGQRSYRLTEDGVGELGAWWDATPDDDPPPRDEIKLKVMLANMRGPEHSLEVITRQRNALMTLRQQRRRGARRGRGARAPSLGALLVADALVLRAEPYLRGIDLCEERLQSEDHA